MSLPPPLARIAVCYDRYVVIRKHASGFYSECDVSIVAYVPLRSTKPRTQHNVNFKEVVNVASND